MGALALTPRYSGQTSRGGIANRPMTMSGERAFKASRPAAVQMTGGDAACSRVARLDHCPLGWREAPCLKIGRAGWLNMAQRNAVGVRWWDS